MELNSPGSCISQDNLMVHTCTQEHTFINSTLRFMFASNQIKMLFTKLNQICNETYSKMFIHSEGKRKSTWYN